LKSTKLILNQLNTPKKKNKKKVTVDDLNAQLAVATVT